jgi:hypothetical protein
VDAKEHAWLARQLIDACGGPRKAAEISGKVRKSRMAQFQDPHSGAIMTMDIVLALETYAAEPIYTRAVMAARAKADGECGASLAEEACDLTEAAASLQRLSRAVTSDGGFAVAFADRRQLLIDVGLVGRHLAAMRAKIAEGVI